MATHSQQSDCDNADNNPNTEIRTPTPVDGGIENAESEHPPTTQPANTRSEAHQPTIIINVPEQQNGTDETANDIAREANDASWASIKVNICLFGLTLIVAAVSIWQGCMTQKSVKITFDALKHQVKKDSVDSARTVRKETADAIADAAKIKRDTLFVNKQKLGIDAQIESLKETQNQFEINSKPYLQIKIDSIRDFTEKTMGLTYYYHLFNLKETPVKVISGYCGYGSGDAYKTPDYVFTDKINRGDDGDNINRYVIKDAPIDSVFKFGVFFGDKKAQGLNGGWIALYLKGGIKYINTYNKKKYYYNFIIRSVMVNNQWQHEFIQNDNKPIN